MTSAGLRAALAPLPSLPLLPAPTIVEPMERLSAALGGRVRLLVKRDDAIPFGFGGNKIRKLALVAGRAKAEGADTLITAGGLQSNHARATAATAARLGMRAILVANGAPPERPTANALLDRLLGAEIVYVAAREERAPAMDAAAARVRGAGGRPFTIPIGASTPLGALAFALAVAEMLEQIPAPDVIVHATSSGGTQAGLVAGCRLLRLETRVIGISADEAAATLQDEVRRIVEAMPEVAAIDAAALSEGTAIEVDDRFVGAGYGVASAESHEALELAARTEALFLDHTYTAKAMAGLIAYVRGRQFADGRSILFWHTGGQVGLFA